MAWKVHLSSGTCACAEAAATTAPASNARSTDANLMLFLVKKPCRSHARRLVAIVVHSTQHFRRTPRDVRDGDRASSRFGRVTARRVPCERARVDAVQNGRDAEHAEDQVELPVRDRIAPRASTV